MHILHSYSCSRVWNACKSVLFIGLLAVSAGMPAQKIWYVSPGGTPSGNGSGWGSTITLADALAKAGSGDQIWLQGFDTVDSGDKYYKVPAERTGYVVPAGVRLYGGFRGDETSPADRVTLGQAYDFRFRSVLSGDFLANDSISPDGLLFPGNATRVDNAPHVLTLQTGAAGGALTSVDGLSITGGQGENTQGGAIRVEGNGDYVIERCFLAENYAFLGGAVYVAEGAGSESSHISLCAVFNNAAGTRGSGENAGAGLYMAGAGAVYNTVVFNNENGGIRFSAAVRVVNSTVVRNSGAGIDLIDAGSIGKAHPVRNTVVWGNLYLSREYTPVFEYCAYHEVVPTNHVQGTDANHNLFISNMNQDYADAAPFFEASSSRLGYDQTFDSRRSAYPQWSWALTVNSALLDRGNDSFYSETQAGTQDITMHRRKSGVIDIGAAECMTISSSRIRYVRERIYGNGSGTSWENATNDLQKAIDELAGLRGSSGSHEEDELGEVWVAGGIYRPSSLLDVTKSYTASFRMRDGIGVYGGFNPDDPELHKKDRKRSTDRSDGSSPMAWEFSTPTVLEGLNYGGTCRWNTTDHKWTLTGESRHVVWFAPFGGEDDFRHPTILDGVVIRGGNAVGDVGRDDFATHRGGGVYMKGSNAQLVNSIVSMNHAADKGGGIFVSGGRILSTLVYNCNADGDGGGVAVDGEGLVLRSMLTNNSARNGGGIYMDKRDGLPAEYMILSTSVVSNNTSRDNAAVYARDGGVVLQSIITNNDTPRSTDAADQNASQTGGFYADGYGLMINSVLWNNRIADRFVPMYAKNPTPERMRFIHVAASGSGNAIWNNTFQQEMLFLVDDNQTPVQGKIGPDFSVGGQMPADTDLSGKIGVQAEWMKIDYFWNPVPGSNLRARGLTLGTFPAEVLLLPELDMHYELFAQKPAIGAYRISATPIVPDNSDPGKLRIYVDMDCTYPFHNGSSWEEGYRSINEALAYFAGLTEEEIGGRTLEIHVMEGNLYPRYFFTNLDPRTATIQVPKVAAPIHLYGGYSRADGGMLRDPMAHRSIFQGNPSGTRISDGLYHVITVAEGAEVVFDGFHITGGYASGNASLTYGAGMLVHSGAKVTLRNSVLDNHTAHEGAAIDARHAALTLENCVVNNCTAEGGSVVSARELNMNHVTLVHNLADRIYSHTEGGVIRNSFATGNYSRYTDGADNVPLTDDINQEVPVSSVHFTNPTNAPGATLGFDTYVGGYSVFRPLTSSKEAAELLINRGADSDGLSIDIAGLGRNLGGVPDLGAYEADLPAAGTVVYVRQDATGDGSSWNNAMGDLYQAVRNAVNADSDPAKRPQVWVAAGTYRKDPTGADPACFIIEEGVNVYGAFPGTGTPGMDERQPLNEDEAFATILQPETEMGNTSVSWVEKAGGDYYFSETETYVRAASQYASYLYISEAGTYAYFSQADRSNIRGSGLDFSTRKDFINVGSGAGSYNITNNNRWESQSGGAYEEFTDPGYYKVAATLKGTYYSVGYHQVKEGATHAHVPVGEYVLVGNGYGNYTQIVVNDYNENDYKNSDYDVQRRVLAQREAYNPRTFGEADWSKNGNYEVNYYVGENFKVPTKWDGFTVQNGFLNIGFENDDGGAGARIFANVTLENCIIQKNENFQRHATIDDNGDSRGGGVFVYGGSLVNCYIRNNKLGRVGNYTRAGVVYGGGVYLNYGTVFNCIISDNQARGHYADGGGIVMEVGEFYNNTVINNSADGSARVAGGLRVWVGSSMKDAGFSGTVKIFNSIIYGNTGFAGVTGNANLSMTDAKVFVQGTLLDGYNHNSNVWNEYRDPATVTANGIYVESSTCPELTDAQWKTVFDESGSYRLSDNSQALNMGVNELQVVRIQVPLANGWMRYDGNNIYTREGDDKPSGNYDWRRAVVSLQKGVNFFETNENINLFDYTDMDYTDRVKDCTVDAGAYEYDGLANTKCDANGIYYVNQNGVDIASGESPAKAACAMKLQRILNAAGERVRNGQYAEVRIAGYEGASFVYHAHTLSNPDDPQSYTYTVPYGVVVKGGYDQMSFDEDPYDANTNPDGRDPAVRMTVLSPVSTEDGQEVNGYHAVTFGAKPEGWQGNGDLRTIVDGLYLEGGQAMATTTRNSRGGGAIVPAWGHVRNCVVRNCEAIYGGGLYLEPGAMVSGTAVLRNRAERGAGMYAAVISLDKTQIADKDNRIHLISNTVAANEASAVGGGIYMEDGAAMALNTVVWGNEASVDKNVSGVFSTLYEDAMLETLFGGGLREFYPFNNCFVETYEMPANFINISMKSDEGLYFSRPSYLLKIYSPLIKTGMESEFYEKLWDYGVEQRDMQGILRVQMLDGGEQYERVDAGAYAYAGGNMPLHEPVYRLFVSRGAFTQLAEDAPHNTEYYKGRSFLTPIPMLNEALAYIRQLRKDPPVGFDKNRPFEILMASGTYKPVYRRPDAAVETIDQRQNSFVVPAGVRIYGGFSGEEKYSSGLDEIPTIDGNIALEKDGDIREILDKREYSDLNSNDILEPWELGNQTILSGNVNVSGNVENVYHVVYSRHDPDWAVGGVELDGLTIMNGETATTVSDDSENNELGRGGGIYSSGVDYRISRCRLLQNWGVHGGALYARDAEVTVIGTTLAGNSAGTGNADVPATVKAVGGAACFSGSAILKAANCLWVNNEARDFGGAIATDANPAAGKMSVDLMNNTIALNKAGEEKGAIFIHSKSQGQTGRIVNTLIWGNKSNDNASIDPDMVAATYSAGEEDWARTGEGNIPLHATDNMEVDGPRFRHPSEVAGADGYAAENIWSPAAISVLTDFGNGMKTVGSVESGAYKDWFETNGLQDYTYYMYNNRTTSEYKRYDTSPDEYGKKRDARIDIGLYEFQYSVKFPELDTIFVDVFESGTRDGTSWGNATSDLKGAITALANPTGGKNTAKVIMIRKGDYDYAISQLSASGVAFALNMSDNSNTHGTSLTIKGSYDATGTPRFEDPTVISPNPVVADKTQWLMTASANRKKVQLEGIRLTNTSDYGNALQTSTGEGGQVILEHLDFRSNSGTAVKAVNAAGTTAGQTLIVNTLFADGVDTGRSEGEGIGLETDERTTVVNATFVHNKVDLKAISSAMPQVYNSVSWNNGRQNLPVTADTHNRVSMSVNNDIHDGPNFMDPYNADVMQRNYNIRPGMLLFNQGSNELYSLHAGADPADGVDLASGRRLVNGTIDIGAYEYNASIRPIIYVKSGVVGGDGSGSSWANAMSDLQSAVNLAGIYAAGKEENKRGYVFVHHNSDNAFLDVSLPGASVYGNMNDEVSVHTPEDEAELTDGQVEAIVSDLLGRRRGVLEAGEEHSLLDSLAIRTEKDASRESMVDGFEVQGNVRMGGKAMLSTAIVGGKVDMEDEGCVLYNSFVRGNVYAENPGHIVNVTAAGTFETASSDHVLNSIAQAGRNAYVSEDIWNYQLNENSPHIDVAGRSTMEAYMRRAGHDRDLAGNPRVLFDTRVDDGCFETWSVPENTSWATTAGEYPVNDYSVVYLHEGADLRIGQPHTFAPAYLLLKDGASLYAASSGVGEEDAAVQLRYVAVEKVLEPGWNMVSVPYALDRAGVQAVDYSGDRAPILSGIDEGNMLVYDGDACAGSLYKFHESESPFWKAPASVGFGASEGFALCNPAEEAGLFRFTARSANLAAPVYTEVKGEVKTVELTQYNRRTVNADGTPHFTYKENMGWNLFGIPYLVSRYDLEWMDIPHVVYPYNPSDKTYGAVQSWTDGGATADGKNVSVGTGIFTQTAVLGDGTKELLRFPQPALPVATASSRRNMDLLRLEGEEGVDRLAFRIRDDASAALDFIPGSDGLKLMAERADVPQLYARSQSGTRFALLDGVNGKAAITVSVRTLAGHYSLGLESADEADNDGEVWLTDHVAKRMVNLKQEPYSFDADGTDGEGRFTISFVRGELPVDLLAVYVEGQTLYVEGLEAGTTVDIYDTAGRRLSSERSVSELYAKRLEPGTYLVKVPGEAVRKVIVGQ